MPYFSVYADTADTARLLLVLNLGPDIAFVVGDGPGRWIAMRYLDRVDDGDYCLWHTPSGPLPLVAASGEMAGSILDPWSGWREERRGGDPTKPWFLDSPGQIWWTVRTRFPKDPSVVGISGFSWIGNYWRSVGSPADPKTEKWWSWFRSTIKKMPSRRITKSGPLDGTKPDVWAMPSALARFQKGEPRAPW